MGRPMDALAPDAAADFEPHRKFLGGLAYRMLGSVAEADDVVQDAFLRWREVDRAGVAEPRAYLARVVSRLCLDRVKSASHRREAYVGVWLPEPVAAEPATCLADDLSVALLLALQRLSPLERAAFLLHDVFDMDYPAVADAIGRNQAACRQLVARAREHVRDERPRYEPNDAEARTVAAAFLAAAVTGDTAGLARTLAEGAVLYIDSGGKKRSALNPIVGRDRLTRFYEGIRSGFPQVYATRDATLNGLPAWVLHTSEGTETVAFEIAQGEIVAIYMVRNPDKVGHLAQPD
jgi:RNA polymerase sigma-70 factor, ECF subfamily